MTEQISEYEYSITSIKWIFSIVRFFSIIMLCYVWIFEAFESAQRPTGVYSTFLLCAFVISIPYSKKIDYLRKQFIIALIVYSICITLALAFRGGIFTVTIALLYPLLIILSAFLLSPNIAYLLAALSIIEYLICITIQYLGKLPQMWHKTVQIPAPFYLDIILSFGMFILFTAFISNRLAAVLLKQNKDLYNSMNKLQQLTILDPLTEVNNRRFLEDKFNEKLTLCKELCVPLSLILIDIDHLDDINQQFGYLEGDKALKQTASIIQKNLGSSSELLFRYGGDEFVILLPEVRIDEAEKTGNMLRNSLTKDNVFHFDTISIPLTACFGVVSTSMLANLSLRNFINNANAALNEAKANGPNSLFKISF
ncbi:MAG: hypothetical protein A2Y62_02435 [Candidatus Fischerbacteria bacterium RBG_13_37_8]|uniref:GGDEF domain-containing protein n=1 Tax=Candidatus Fischerbacteria bacterium RBG_13_37_8 TaxID=1817863 RepID=A0A1F5VI10_9BACT|nr:MAG: hypothetical protein A2Y62_02435 [Candidatus Fischerbacteria bacterium RBG_13_37_8]